MIKALTIDRLIERFVIAALAVFLTGCGQFAFAQTPVSTPPAATSFKLGAFNISVLHDGALSIQNNGLLFGLNAGKAAVAKVLGAAGAPTDQIRLDVDALLIRTPNKTVLIDTGYGAADHGLLQESLTLVGLSPNDITDILITHAHPDHVGGLVNAKGQPAFPNATIWLSAREWKFFQTQAELKAEIPVITAQVKTFQPGSQVVPGITSISLPGHTPGHVGYEIASQGVHLVDIGDTVHSSIVDVVKPDWTLAWDSDKAEAVKTRRTELQRLANTHELLFAPHFPFPGVGHIDQTATGFRFKPSLPLEK